VDRLTAQDLMMLWPEELGWSQDIGALAILDGSGLLDADGRFRIGTAREEIGRRLHRVPRFRQLLYRPRLGLGRSRPLWEMWFLPGLPDGRVGLLVDNLRRRLQELGHAVARLVHPVAMHQEQPGQAQGNRDGMMVVPLPIGEPADASRLR
jgi:hypothetical protein